MEQDIKEQADARDVPVTTIRAEVDPTLAEIRAEGLARASGSITRGINGFSGPVYYYSGSMIAAITTLGAVGHFDDSWASPIAEEVRRASQSLSQRLVQPTNPSE